MPYPASPPDLPIIPAPANEEIRYSNQSPSASRPPSSPPTDTNAIGALTHPNSPETITPSPAQVTVADSANHARASQAALLGSPKAAGYLFNTHSLEPGSSKTIVPPAGTAKFSPFDRVLPPKQPSPGMTRSTANSVPLPFSATSRSPLADSTAKSLQPKPAQVSAPTAAPTSYSISGLKGQVTAKQESDVLSELNRAIVLDDLQDDFDAANLDGSLTGKPLKLVAQAAGEPPLTLPIPTTDSPIEGSPASTADPAKIPTGQPATTPANQAPAGQSAPAGSVVTPVRGVIELTADRQEYDEQRKIFTAEGKVLMRFQGALLDADRVQVNLVNRLAVAEGNVALTRGDQVLRGQRFEYNFVQGIGTVQQASGVIYLPSTGTDLGSSAEGDEGVTLNRPVSDRVTINQPVERVSSPGGFSTTIGAGRNVGRVPGALPNGGTVRRLRFEAETIDFTPQGWTAQNIQITNDPFSPPELVLKADRATLTRLSPLRDEVRATRARLVFDQRLSIPLLASRVVLDRNERPPALVQFGFDSEDRGGLFAQSTFEILRSDRVQLTLTPQVFLQRMIFDEGTPFDPSNYGGIVRLKADISPRTSVRGVLALTSLDPDEIKDTLRASIRARQLVGTHTLGLEYSYRDRLFNGSLGFQTVQSSLGALLLSPVIPLGKSGINLTYQAGVQYINSDTDRLDLLEPIRDDNRINLTRYQTSAALSRGFGLWRGKALPATPTEGLRYSPFPIVPYLSLDTRLEGVFSGYSSGDTQQNLIARVGVSGQFGHFSRKFFDYTAFNISYTQFIGSGQSPFLFDRTVDNRILNLGIIQQIYGPIRAGFQTSLSLDNNGQISTDYILEYSRRTYAIALRYNPVLAIGSLNFRINDFNWTGGSQPFSGVDVTPVEGGVRRGSGSD